MNHADYAPEMPLIVQSDGTILLELASNHADRARDVLLGFAELIKSPEYVHTWRLTHLTLWNAAASGLKAEGIVQSLQALAKYPVPAALSEGIADKMSAWGRYRLVRDGAWLRLEAADALDIEALRSQEALQGLFADTTEPTALRVAPSRRGELKATLMAFGYPVEDRAGYDDGHALTMALRTELADGTPWSLRPYQIEAVDAFHAGPNAGSGVLVLPCGAGKTLIGIAAMVRLGMRTLVLCTSHEALMQWRREILLRTTLSEDDVGIYTADVKQLAPVTITTYQILTWRPRKNALPPHLKLFHDARWGLVIYDEVHLLPAPIFRESAALQARRRLGLTATLVREDGHEGDVFALIGPKRFDIPWKQLEAQGWIATVRCVEVRVSQSPEDRLRMLHAKRADKHKIAAQNARKGAALERLLQRHCGERILVLGTYLDSLHYLARRFAFPIVTGAMPIAERHALYERFRRGEIHILAMSKVGNFSVDLPEASVAIEVSGTWGSRQEEAQRLGRVLRPKADARSAWFYTLVTVDSPEATLAHNRQLFLLEQGYPYQIESAP